MNTGGLYSNKISLLSRFRKPVYAFTGKSSQTLFCRPGRNGATAFDVVFGKGFLDLLDNVLWMLPFSSDAGNQGNRAGLQAPAAGAAVAAAAEELPFEEEDAPQ